jgi:Calcineurin-like phosphoesterase
MTRTSRTASNAFQSPLVSSLTFVLAIVIPTGPADAKPLAAWIELVGPGGAASIRAIVSKDSACPAVQSGRGALQMHVRSEPGPSTLAKKAAEFPVRVCEADAPKGKTSMSVDGLALPDVSTDLRRIVVLGDTGCRIKKGKTQDCDDPHEWPYRDMATRAAAAHPDLVIHVGDYLYREKSCQGRAVVCPDTPVGYGWDVWNADFFKPSAKLFAAAPWIMVRGNHETCARAGFASCTTGRCRSNAPSPTWAAFS